MKTILKKGIIKTSGPATRFMDVAFGNMENIRIRQP